MKFFRFILSLVNWVIVAGITIFALYLVSSNFSILGKYRSFLVQSGSMEPAIMTGDIIIIESKTDYQKNDVVTFKNQPGRIVTHRIVETSGDAEKIFSTKGDANVTGDEDTITNEQIIGKVVLVVPRLGYFAAFAKSPRGLIFLLLVPAAIFVMDELVKISKNVKAKS